MHNEIEARAKQAIEERVFPGCVIGVVRSNGEREVFPFGNLTYERDSPAVRGDTVYDVASITKSIPTASLALTLAAEGKFALGDKLVTYIPEFRSKWREEITLEHLLRYGIHGLQLSTLKDKTSGEILESAYSRELADTPGTQFLYTNLPALLLGIVIERTSKGTLDVLARKYFFGPLGMRDTTFFPQKYGHGVSIFAPTETVDGDEIRGIVHDESARVFAKAGKAVGHAGLFSTVPDLLNFLERLLRGDEGFTKSIIAGAEKGLGWQVNDARFMGKYAHPRTFGKTGFTGTSCVVDLERGKALVILSNRTFPKRPKNDDAIYQLRADIADIVLE